MYGEKTVKEIYQSGLSMYGKNVGLTTGPYYPSGMTFSYNVYWDSDTNSVYTEDPKGVAWTMGVKTNAGIKNKITGSTETIYLVHYWSNM